MVHYCLFQLESRGEETSEKDAAVRFLYTTLSCCFRGITAIEGLTGDILAAKWSVSACGVVVELIVRFAFS